MSSPYLSIPAGKSIFIGSYKVHLPLPLNPFKKGNLWVVKRSLILYSQSKGTDFHQAQDKK